WWAAACSLAVAVAAGLAVPAQTDLWRVSHHWELWRSGAAERGLSDLQRALDDAVRESSADAARALDAPNDRPGAFQALARLDRRGEERGTVLFAGDTEIAWTGTVRVPVDSARIGTSLVATPFYLALT